MPLSDAAVRQRLEAITRHLDNWGDVIPIDSGRLRIRRLLEFELTAPGGDLDPEVRLFFREYFDRTEFGDWELRKYTYDYFDLRRNRRLAFHLHPLGSPSATVHAHCGSGRPTSEEPSEHFRAIQYELREAHEEFMRLYARDEAPDCRALWPLENRVERAGYDSIRDPFA